MEITNAYNKIIDFSLSKKWDLSLNNINNRGQNTFGYNFFDNLILYIDRFPKWKELLKKGYSEEQLIDYFLEMVRVELPELKGFNIEFRETNDPSNKIITI